VCFIVDSDVDSRLYVVVVDVLSSLSALYIQRRFDYDFVDVGNVTMQTVAVSTSNDLDVSHVENCTCDSGINVAGRRGC